MMRKHKSKLTAGVIVAIILAVVFWYGGDAPGLRGGISGFQEPEFVTSEEKVQEVFVSSDCEKEKNDETTLNVSEQKDDAVKEETEPKNIDTTPIKVDKKEELSEKIPGENPNEVKIIDEKNQANKSLVTDEQNQEVTYFEENPPVELSESDVSDKELTCILSVRCDTILNNISWLNKDKTELVPKDGVIFAEREVVFYEGESVFNILSREMKRNKIHLEFENVPINNSAYIEGIANLYEFDCGELSGWMYKVNGWFPNYGCSRYRLKAGDRVEWVYTCDHGKDVGGQYLTRGNL